jgi:phospho-N-acetylmuramoyl-pentapeptide-transferase
VIYELLYPLSKQFGWASALNVLRYVPFRVILATITAMLLVFLLAPWFIRELQKKQIGQVVRKDGPESHFKKAGTPTMGGALILLSVLVPTMLWSNVSNTFVIATAVVTAGYGVIGYIDDRRKIVAKNSKGLAGKYKLLGQTLIATVALSYVFLDHPAWLDPEPISQEWFQIRYELSFPFLAFSKYSLELPSWAYIAFAVFVVVATSNAVNLTDGLDGLAIGPVMINAGTYLIWAYVAGTALFGQQLAVYLDIPGIDEMSELSIFAAAVVGSGIGFLWYNTYPAQVFMGDVGSLSLGGGLGMLAVLTKNELLSVLIGGVFFVETVSVITQVAWYKTFGRRIFLMAPIHHHFEKKGWPEPKIIVRFWIISILLALVGLSSLKLR